MIAGIPLAFAEPLVLLGLLSLPILWWLLRLVPPRPRRIDFPPTRMLFDIAPKEETPSRTPWWLTLLRLVLAALVIIAAAGPLWNPPVATTSASGPLLLLIDDGFAAASTWDARLRTAEDLIARADADGRGVAVAPLSVTARDISLETPSAARARLRLVKPQPHALERTEAIPALERFLMGTPDIEIVWLSDGVDAGHAADFVLSLARIADKRPITIVEGGIKPARALTAADNAAGVLSVKVLRAAPGSDDVGAVRALDLKGLPLGEASFSFKSDERETDAQLDLPVEIRNDIARIEIEGERSAGAVQLLDKRWRRRTVGVITGSTADTAQPLLASTFYLSRALSPFADVRLADRASPGEMVNQFIDQHLPMIILADVGTIAGDAHDRLTRWIDDGGVLVRFAGPRLAAADDQLVPVKLRRGGRILGGSLSWDQPQQLAAFSRESPFNGMTVPNDVTVSRQVLAEPDAGLSEHTWAMLADGTPLVTAARKGKGMIVLFHVTADTKWSDLPLSGAFVDMLKRIVGISGATASTEANAATGAQSTARDAVPPTRVLDGFGSFEPPPPTARPVPAGYVGRATADNPPGFYGPPEGLVAVNTLAPADRLVPIDFKPLNSRLEYFRTTEPQDLRGPVFTAALVLLLIDALVVFWLAGGIYRLLPRRRLATGLMIVAGVALALAVTRGESRAADPKADQFASRATLETHLAYVVTGDGEADSVSKSGLTGLTTFLAQRTALEAGDPIGVDLERDELAFFPIVYWPIVPGAKKPSPQALARVDAYMKQGGTMLFDTRDAVLAPPGPGGEANSPGMVELRSILSSLDIPELEPVPRDHVLTKTFFLLRDFPGRFTSGQLWVEALQSPDKEEDEDNKRPARGGDGVSSIIITSNDLAGAWATRPDGQAMLPLVPGEPRQREFAFRAGVNIVMYTLTGNYKADQVHVPALLERLGQ
ncbi:MAG TPA: DUF4159 domain-containing protein [Xanthobacteraceae bacterium]|nr:DUF4159 domain-containing protein [Xanthobacteraceae bacterium]